MGWIIITAFVFCGIGYFLNGVISLGKTEDYEREIKYLQNKIKVLKMSDDEIAEHILNEVRDV